MREITSLDQIQHSEQMDMLIREGEFMTVKQTGAVLSLDGNQYCWLFGENLQVGIAGFGDTPYLAMLDFNKAFYDK